ncbi:MAG: rhodanese-like domain-containing protein [Pikeienuella sp.]
MAIKSIFKMVEEATAVIDNVDVDEAMARREEDDFLLVDIRDIRELNRDGRIPGAYHAPRGMLEFWVDPASPYHKPVFAEGKRLVFFCASAGRSAIAVKALNDMGLENAAQLVGGFKAWQAAGGVVDKGE